MEIKTIQIDGIPGLLWGEKSDKFYIAIHGNMSNKEDTVIRILADVVTRKGYQVLSFDLPEHGERKEDISIQCNPQNCIKELNQIMYYAKEHYNEINLWACSMGAYFSLLTYNDTPIKQCIFLSPVVNMKFIIDNMMSWSTVNIEELKERKVIKTNFGPTLYWDYYKYVEENPIIKWDKKTYILYGSNDDMQNKELVIDFCHSFNCNLTIVEDGEHFFHTDEQLAHYKKWLNEVITK